MATTTAMPVDYYANLFGGIRIKRAWGTKPVEVISIKKNRDDDDHDDDNPCFKKFRGCNVLSRCAKVEEHYETLEKISSGSFGVVFRARDKKTGEIVGIKQEFDGLSKSSSREIEILKSLDPHPYIVRFKNVAFDDLDSIYVVMEYLEYDLRRYIKENSSSTDENVVKLLIKQLLEGVKFLHDNGVMHRDLKPSNILMNGSGHELKICDFGLSRHFGSESGSYTPNVGTLWYIAPELFLGVKEYSSAIDMWSVGCIMAEMLLKEVLFRGNSEFGQLKTIYGILGTPNDDVLPGFCNLPGSRIKFAEIYNCNILRNKIPDGVVTEVGFDLLKKLLAYDPAKRLTAEAALNHEWFKDLE